MSELKAARCRAGFPPFPLPPQPHPSSLNLPLNPETNPALRRLPLTVDVVPRAPNKACKFV